MNTKLFCAFHQHDQHDQGVLDLKMKSLILNDAQHDISNVHSRLGCIQILKGKKTIETKKINDTKEVGFCVRLRREREKKTTNLT